MRGIDLAAFATTTLNLSTVTAPYLLFDAANGIPAVTPGGCTTYFTSGCRTVFTHTTEGSRPARVPLNTLQLTVGTGGGADTDGDGLSDLHEIVGTELSVTEAQTLISRILAGHYNSGTSLWESRLGAVDRSTPAVIPESPLAGGARPTMVYFGAADGMLHAVCADVQSYCDQKGRELWAYIPRTQLPLVRQNRQRIDGSPTVADVFGDFDNDPTTPPNFRTVLTFTTGSGDPGFVGSDPAVIALDITNPSDPKVLWELTTSAVASRADTEHQRDGFDLGYGTHLAMGVVDVSGTPRALTFAHTNNGGTAHQPGSVVKAIDTITGEVVWSRSGGITDLQSGLRVPATAIPAGVTLADVNQDDIIDTVLVPSLRGRIWRLDADTGASVYGGNALFSFGSWAPTAGADSDFHPFGASLTLFRERGTGDLMVLGVSGGYADPIGIHQWLTPDTATQYAIAVPVESPSGNATPRFVIDLGVGNRAFSQAVVAGNEIFVTTDNFDANSLNYGLTGPTGSLLRYDLTDATALGANTVADAKGAATLSGAAGGVDVKGGVVVGGSGSAANRADFSSDFDAAGIAVESQSINEARRLIWLRLR